MEIISMVCAYPTPIVMGVASLVGALIYSGISVLIKKKTDYEFEFEWNKILDTVWQSTVAGAVAGIPLGCGLLGVLVAMLTGVGVDKACNKFKVNEVQFLNLMKYLVGYIEKKFF